MTRESVPRFDLYAELEVPRSAAPAQIEAAHRALAKLHHPDVALASAGAADWAAKALAVAQAEERIKRINVARDWLLDPERRERYDRALRRREGGPAAPGDFEAKRGAAAWTSFGPNADKVRQFLADLGDIDERRAHEIWDGRRSIDPDDYAHARRAAFAISRSRRLSEWLFSRDAAAGVVREQLGDGRLAAEVGDILAEAAGAIAVRDLLPPMLFDTLMHPWIWRATELTSRASRPVVMTTAAGRAATGARAAPPPPAPAAAPRVVLPPKPREPRRPLKAPKAALPILVASSAGLIVIATLVGAATLFHPFTGGIAGIEATGRPSAGRPTPPANTGAGETPAATPVPTQPGGIDPALLATLRQRASNVITRLEYYQARGFVKSAQKLLGDTAPGLLTSGLARATFPDLQPTDITIAQVPGGWQAIAGTDTLTSPDGLHWTFDWGARPLAHYGKGFERDLFFVQGSTNRDILVSISSVTVTRESLVVSISWRYGSDACAGCDGSHFVDDELRIPSVTLGDTTTFLPDDLVAALDGTPGKTTVHIAATLSPTSSMLLDVAVVNPSAGSTGGRPFTTIETSFSLRQG